MNGSSPIELLDGGDLEPVLQSFRDADCRREDLIQALLKRIREQDEQVQRITVDYENERESRTVWQMKARAFELENSAYKPFVVALIDGDGAPFHDTLVQASGESGGADAAHKLMQAISTFISNSPNIPEHCSVVVRIYANLEGLSKCYRHFGILNKVEALSSFYRGFTSSQHLFDLIDVGPGKERADTKLRENFNLFLGTAQCKHIILGGICHDNGYRNMIAPYSRDSKVTSRVTLLQNYDNYQPEYKQSGFNIIRFGDIFRSTEIGYASANMANSPAENRPSNANSLSETHISTKPVVNPPTPPAPAVLRTPPPVTRTITNDILEAQSALSTTSADAEKGRSLYVNRDGLRLDPPIRPPVTQAARAAVDARRSEGNLCNRYHLQGLCSKGTHCQYVHGERLSGAELSCLMTQARTTPCSVGGDCRDYYCPLGHVCPQRPCTYGDRCKFSSAMHQSHLNMTAERRMFESGHIKRINILLN